MLSPASITMVSICPEEGEAGWGGGRGGGGGWEAITTFFFLPRLPFTGMGGAAAVSVTIWAPPTSPVATLRGSVSPVGNCRRFPEVSGLRGFGEGLMATVFCGVTEVVAAGIVMGVVMIAWLVPGMSWICPACGITWIVWGPWICGTTWYWMLVGVGLLVRAGLCWMVSTIGLPGVEGARLAGSWITLPLADRNPKFLGGAGAIGAGLMGRSLRGCGCAGEEVTGAWAAGGPILLQVAARRASGEGWVSYREKHTAECQQNYPNKMSHLQRIYHFTKKNTESMQWYHTQFFRYSL